MPFDPARPTAPATHPATPAPPAPVPRRDPRRDPRRARLPARGLALALLAGAVLAGAGVGALMPAAPRLEDAALDRLLVAMAVLKGGMGAVLVGAAAWMLARMRGGGADHPAWTALHLVAAGLMAAGLVPMLTLSAPAMGAGMFHVGMVVGVVATLGDPRLRAALGRAVDARRHRR